MKKKILAAVLAGAAIASPIAQADPEYLPAKSQDLSQRQLKVLNEFAFALGSQNCTPNGAKTYAWRRVRQDVYDAAKRLNVVTPEHTGTKFALHNEFVFHIKMGVIPVDSASVGMFCVKTRAIGAVTNAVTIYNPVEAWVNEDDLEHVIVRELDPNFDPQDEDSDQQRYSKVFIQSWEDIQAYVDQAKQKDSRDNY